MSQRNVRQLCQAILDAMDGGDLDEDTPAYNFVQGWLLHIWHALDNDGPFDDEEVG